MNKLFYLIAFSAICLTCGPSSAATAMSLSDEGVVIDDGSGSKLTFNYPQLNNSAKKNAKITEKSFDSLKATAKYAGGGELALEVAGDELRLKFSSTPADTKMIYATMSIPTTIGQGGKWSTGGKLVDFAGDKSPKPILYQGAAESLQLVSSTGGNTVITIPSYSYQQLQDNREWGLHTFQWQVWMPFYPENPVITLKVADAASVVKTVAVKSVPATAKAKAESAAPQKPEVRLEKVSDTQVVKWKDGKQAVFLLAFDDGCPSHLKNVIPELHKRKIPATFYPIANNGMVRDQPAWAKEAKPPEVILGNHTFNHKGCTNVEQLNEELSKANDAINERVAPASTTRLISFGQPGGLGV